MKVRYFADTDTLLIEFRSSPVAETRDLDENTILDVDATHDATVTTIFPWCSPAPKRRNAASMSASVNL
jgi:uncharacterized protein DUF2283